MANRADVALMFQRATLRVGALVVIALAFGGCRKKTAPQYYQLESNVTILADRDGDEAWSSDEMSAALTALKAIDPDTVEGPKAAALALKIEGERARLARERAEAAAATAREVPRPTVRLFDDAKATAAPVDAGAAPDASVPDRPWPGMSQAEFEKLFGECMRKEGEQPVPGLGQATVYAARDDLTSCRSRYGLPDDGTVQVTFVFQKERYVAQRTATRIPGDAGAPTTVVVDAGEPRLSVLPIIRDVVDAGP